MERRAFLVTTASALSFGCIGLGGPDNNEENEEIDPGTVGDIITTEINNRRSNQGLNELNGNSTLVDVALNHTEYMARQGELFRVGPDGREPWERVEDAGYDCERQAEQNAMRVSNPSALGNREAALTVVDTFAEEEPTRQNLFDEDREEHGIGVAVTEDYLYVTHILC